MTRAPDSRSSTASHAAPSGIRIKTKFNLVIVAVVAVIAGMFVIGKTGLETLSAIRAYADMEGVWAEGQAGAADRLDRYTFTFDDTDFEEYEEHLTVPLILREVRLELERSDPDVDVVRRGLVGSGLALADVDPMITLFRRFGEFDEVEAALDVWARADARLLQLQSLGTEIRDRVQAGDMSPDDLQRLRDSVDRIHRDLSNRADDAGLALGDAGRWARGLAVRILVAFSLLGTLVCIMGLTLVARIGAALERSNAELAGRNRNESARAALSDLLQGESRLRRLLPDVLSFLADFVDAPVGAVYVARDGAVLHLCGSTGISDPEELPAEIPFGQGIVGQVAQDGTSRLLERVPDDYFNVRSALGETRPANLFVLPFVAADEETKAVVEVAAPQSFDPDALEFLESVTETVARTVETLQARDRVDDLLQETQQMAEELEAQQEELRQTNSELEAQATALEESQSDLEELNSVLEEKSEALQAEQLEVEERNAHLEATRRLLLEQAEQLESTSRYKSEFLANMSHELRTPLNSVLLLSNLLAKNTEDTLTEKQIEFAETIHSSGTDLLALINEVLDLSKVESGRISLNMDEVTVETFLSDLDRGFRQAAIEKGISFTTEIESGVPSSIQTDEQRLGQILKNLLSNAIKFTEDGGVALRVSRLNPTETEFASHELPEGPVIAFSVADTGIGIPESKRNTVFEAFQQVDASTERKYGGTGLGLAISKELAELLGGRIHLDSKLGEGSRFTVAIPAELATQDSEGAPQAGELLGARPETVEEDPRASDVPSEVPCATPTVEDDRDDITPGDRCLLIVEDDAGFASALLALARDRGFKGLVAESGRAGLELAQRHVPSAVLLDIGLPDIDGMSVMEHLKEDLETRHIPVHVISGGDRKFEALKKGALGFLLKPVTEDQLEGAFSRIESLLSRPVRRLLIALGNEPTRTELVDLIDARDVDITAVASGREVLDQLVTSQFDCLLMEAELPDMSGVELVKRVRSGTERPELHVVAIVTEATAMDERLTLERYADSVIVKGGRYSERVLDETALFLHRVEEELPEDQRHILRRLHDKEAILADSTVLLVDDDMRNIFALSSILEEQGVRTLTAKTGIEGLARLEEYPDIDLVLMDIMMPELDGYTAIRRLRENPKFENLPVIALTAKAMKGDRAKCIEAGASDYLVKPVDTERLFSMLRVWLYQ